MHLVGMSEIVGESFCDTWLKITLCGKGSGMWKNYFDALFSIEVTSHNIQSQNCTGGLWTLTT